MAKAYSGKAGVRSPTTSREAHQPSASARQEWLANPRRDLLAGTVEALALIPEAIADKDHLPTVVRR